MTTGLKKLTYTVKELAAVLGTSEPLIRRAAAAGKLPHVRVESKILFSKVKIEEWLNKEVTNAGNKG